MTTSSTSDNASIRPLAATAALIGLSAFAGEFLWNQDITATIGSHSNIVECAPPVLGAVSGIAVDRKKIDYQYGYVHMEMTLRDNSVVHGHVQRTGQTSAMAAFYGRQADEPVALKVDIARKLVELQAAIQAGCSR